VQCFTGDVSCKKDVERVLKGVDCVFHLASYGMSGKEMLQFGKVDNVNINGTCHVLEACIEYEINRLVYVSTYNVVFGGKEIVNGNETLPYFPMDDHIDPYGRSKSIAEQLVLKSNGRPFKGKKGKCLYTCAIRPAAIYGPGEERHFPRIITLAKLGLLPFRIGEVSVKTDWVYVDNLVVALILASMALLDDIPGKQGQPMAAGQPYFISDGSPVNTFEFIKPLLRSLDYDVPKASLTVPHALIVANIFRAIYTAMYPLLSHRWLPQPLLLPTEVHKIGITHYCNYIKAREELGYVPMVSPREGMAATIEYYKDRKQRSVDGPTIYVWLFCVVGMLGFFCVAYLPAYGPVIPLRSFALLFMRSMWMLRFLFIVSVFAHIGEAYIAWRLATRIDPSNASAWFWQTFALGYFSLGFLLKRDHPQTK
jgi:nucleoside-diphosphate-sugar epimerase